MAIVKDVSFVVMAETAALALAATIASNMGLMQVSFLTDCSQLHQFFLALDQANPADWRMKTYIQQFKSCATRTKASLFKISHNDNTTTDSLAKEAFLHADSVHQPCFLDCSYGAHSPQCLLFQAPESVPDPCTFILSASCC
jgi:hypothetical protein